MQPEKSNFAVTSIQYLGFELTQEGLKISLDKVKVIKALTPPKGRKSLQLFLGLLKFFDAS